MCCVVAMLRNPKVWLPVILVHLGCLTAFFAYKAYRHGQNFDGWNPWAYLDFKEDVHLQKFTPESPAKKATFETTTRAVEATVRQIPDSDTLHRMSHLRLHKLYHSYIGSPQVACSAVERMGLVSDGGWEICDDPLYRPPDRNNCLVYSFGINYDFSFDDDIAEYGCEVHSFDPSMGGIGDHLRRKRVHFHSQGVGCCDGVKRKVGRKKGVWTLYSLHGFRKRLGHPLNKRQLDIVKMDIEGDEHGALTQALNDGSLSDVRQLAFETHVTMSSRDASREQYIKFLELLRGVYDAGFRIYVTHRNYVYTSFASRLTRKERVRCHEVHTVNVELRQNPGQPMTHESISAETRQ